MGARRPGWQAQFAATAAHGAGGAGRAPPMPRTGRLRELPEESGRAEDGLQFGSRIGRLAIILALAVGALAATVRTQAATAPTPEKTYVAFFLGQGGYLFSWGIPYLAAQAQRLGIETDIFQYSEFKSAWRKISHKKADGYKIGLVGYSLGNTTATYLQKHMEVDLLLAIAQSSLGRNHNIKKGNTRRSVLWYGPDFLSNAGLKNGFDEINYVYNTHLLMDVDPRVVQSVLDELQDLIQLEKNDGSDLAAGPIGAQTASLDQTDVSVTGAVQPAPPSIGGGRWLPSIFPISQDVTCPRCWGFRESWLAPVAPKDLSSRMADGRSHGEGTDPREARPAARDPRRS